MFKQYLEMGLVFIICWVLATLWGALLIGSVGSWLIENWWRRREEHVRKMSKELPDLHDYEMINERAN